MAKSVDTLASALEEPIHLAAFEGPLDLLLYLVRKSEIDIYDIPIAEITRQYMEVIENAREDQLEIAGDFFVLAATLMRIKSRMLLPSEIRPDAPDDDSVDDPRWELAKMLLEYNRFKEAAGELAKRIDAASDLLPRKIADETSADNAPLKPLDRFDIWGTFNAIMRRLAERLREGHIEPEKLSVSDSMEDIRARIKDGGSFRFTDLLPADGPISRLLVAVCFLAMLELTRVGVLQLTQASTFDDIIISAKPQDATQPVIAPTTDYDNQGQLLF